MDIKLNDIMLFAGGFGVCWLVNKLAKRSEHFGYSAPFASDYTGEMNAETGDCVVCGRMFELGPDTECSDCMACYCDDSTSHSSPGNNCAAKHMLKSGYCKNCEIIEDPYTCIECGKTTSKPSEKWVELEFGVWACPECEEESERPLTL